MFAYARAAIDWWAGWLTENDYKNQINSIYSQNDAAKRIAGYETLRERAFALASKVGWEGDIREGPFIAGLPTHETGDDGYIIIAWKQDNNGDTFVVSPFKLPWLEEGDYGKWVSS